MDPSKFTIKGNKVYFYERKKDTSKLATMRSGKQTNLSKMSDSENEIISGAKTNIYPGADPKLVYAGDTELLIYVDTDLSRAAAQQTVLMYSVYDEISNEWSVPEQLDDDLTADASPIVYTNGNDIYVVYQLYIQMEPYHRRDALLLLPFQLLFSFLLF